MRYFADCQGEAVRLTRIEHDGRASNKPANFSGLCPKCGERHQASRKIDYVEHGPSGHLCNAKCLTGAVNGRCECRCGGKNHGRGGVLAALARGASPL